MPTKAVLSDHDRHGPSNLLKVYAELCGTSPYGTTEDHLTTRPGLGTGGTLSDLGSGREGGIY